MDNLSTTCTLVQWLQNSDLGSRKKKNPFQIIDKLFQSGSTTRPSYSSLESLVEDINDFFIGKIQSITNELQKRCIVNHLMQSQSPTLAQEFNLMPVSCWTPFSLFPQKQVFSTTSHAIRNYADFLSPVITSIVNQSLSTGEFPSPFKLSHVRPRLKKDNLEK